MQEVAEYVSPVERALVDAVMAEPAPFRWLPVALLSRETEGRRAPARHRVGSQDRRL